MSIIYPEAWHRPEPRPLSHIETLLMRIDALQDDLRALGYDVAANLVAASAIAVSQGLAAEQEGLSP